MTPAVVLVGPTVVRGPGSVDSDLVEMALTCIDDGLALVEDRAVPVAQLWSDVMDRAIEADGPDVVLVVPSWWSPRRVATVEAAAGVWSGNVVIRRRSEVLTTAGPMVEIAPELVVVHADGERLAVARDGPSAGVADAVVAGLDGMGPVTLDVPTGAARFGAELTRALRRAGIAVAVCGDHDVVRAAVEQCARVPTPAQPAWRRVTPRAATLAGAAVVVVALGAAAMRTGGGPSAEDAVTWLVEGRVAVEVPEAWTVERITSGPGSARMQVISPDSSAEVVYVTQARTGDVTLASTADALRVALAGEAEGVFVDFTAADHRADRPAVTYREVRPDRQVRWTVLLDRGMRIAIGCQSAGDRTGAVCDRAVRSAHAIG